MSVVDRFDDAVAVDKRIRKVADLDGGFTLIETARYQEFTDILRDLGALGRSLSEIAGNHKILVTVLARSQVAVEATEANGIFSIPINSHPVSPRLALD